MSDDGVGRGGRGTSAGLSAVNAGPMALGDLAEYFAGLEPAVLASCFVACLVDAAGMAGFGVDTAGKSTGELADLGRALIAVREGMRKGANLQRVSKSGYEPDYETARAQGGPTIGRMPMLRPTKAPKGMVRAAIVERLKANGGAMLLHELADGLAHVSHASTEELRRQSVQVQVYSLVREGRVKKEGRRGNIRVCLVEVAGMEVRTTIEMGAA